MALADPTGLGCYTLVVENGRWEEGFFVGFTTASISPMQRSWIYCASISGASEAVRGLQGREESHDRSSYLGNCRGRGCLKLDSNKLMRSIVGCQLRGCGRRREKELRGSSMNYSGWWRENSEGARREEKGWYSNPKDLQLWYNNKVEWREEIGEFKHIHSLGNGPDIYKV